jgi:hypothetical protein
MRLLWNDVDIACGAEVWSMLLWPNLPCHVLRLPLVQSQSYTVLLFEGSLEVKLPTIWTDEKQSRAEAERRERLEERRVEEKESEERRCRCAKR